MARNTIKSVAANIAALANKTAETRSFSQSISQQIADLIRQKKITDRKGEDAKAFGAALKKEVEAQPYEPVGELTADDVKRLAIRCMDAQRCYAWNIVEGKGDANGRTLPEKKGAQTNKAGKIEKPEKEVPQVRHIVTREAAIAFFGSALGGNTAENEFALAYMLDNPGMRDKLIAMVKFAFESAALRKAA